MPFCLLLLLSFIIIIIDFIIAIIIVIINGNKYDINPSQIGKRQLHFIRLNHVLFDLSKLSKDTAFMFTITPFSSVKLTARKNF